MHKIQTGLWFLLLLMAIGCKNENSGPEPERIYNILDFGAVADGVTLNSDAINKAIDECHNNGGGTVLFPEGIFMSGSIHLKSNVTLRISAGATLLGAPNNIGAYDAAEPNQWDAYQDFGHSHFRNALIWAENQENIAIEGEGHIHGGGMTDRNYMPEGGGDKIISLKLCKNITIRNLRMEQGGHFVLLANGCDNLLIENVKVFTPRDGFNIISCQDVKIAHCFIETIIWEEGRVSEGDDAIGIKSDFALGYPRESKNIHIDGCVIFSGGANAFNIGSETVGNFTNIKLTNLSIQGAEKAGIGITTNDGAVIDSLYVSNVVMSKVATPFYINTGQRLRRPDATKPGKIKNVYIENVRVTDVQGYVKDRGPWASTVSGIAGAEHMAENITFRNVSIEYKGRGTFDWQNLSPPDPSTGYSPRNLADRPAYGFYIRHAKNVRLENVSLTLEKDDSRPAVFAKNVERLVFDQFSAVKSPMADFHIARLKVTGFELKNSSNILSQEIAVTHFDR